MEKTLVFLYPIKEYIRMIDLDQATFDKFIRTLDLRYRFKGYNIYFVTFPDKEVSLPVDEKDRVIFTDISFSKHTTKCEDGKYVYPNPDFIIDQLPESSEYVICGFHAADCVERVANHFYEKGMNTIVDIHLTDLFYGSIQNPYFNEEKYNLATHIEWLKGKELAFKEVATVGNMIEKNYSKPFYKLKDFISEITAEDIAVATLTEYLEKQKSRINKSK